MSNSALVPVPKLEDDFYDWYVRHEQKVAAARNGHYDLVFLGDSITHLFAGDPNRAGSGETVWTEYYASRNALNLGFGWDRTQNLLWRLQHGEFAGQTPRLAVLNIGTNNLTATDHARSNTPAEIAAGVHAVIDELKTASPDTHVLNLGVFPRGPLDGPFREPIRELNGRLRQMAAGRQGVTFMDIGAIFLDDRGEIIPERMPDLCHPGPAGYLLWAQAIEPTVAAFCPAS